MEERILELLKDYVAVKTHTGTEMERDATEFFRSYFEANPYFRAHPEQWGSHPVKDDFLQRRIQWGLVKGQGDETVILIHHTDTVDAEDYGPLKELAYTLDGVKEPLREGQVPVGEEVKEDLQGDTWIFGRGASDMKGGGCMALALLEEYAREEDFQGNVLLLGVPDEENSSAGMRSAAYLLEELEEKYGLHYQLMIDVEPHERIHPERFSIYDGSIGKVMPIVLARGKLAHTGQIYAGLSPIHMMSALVRKTELLGEFVEREGTTTAPGPTWLYLKDRKYLYDVSLPATVGGYMSVLPLTRSPKDILERLKELSVEAFEEVLKDSRARYEIYRNQDGLDYGDMDHEAQVLTVDELKAQLLRDIPKEVLEAEEWAITQKIQEGAYDRVEGSFRLMEFYLEQWKNRDPVLLIGLAAPYYPAVNNGKLPSREKTDAFVSELADYIQREFELGLDVQNYFTGICDLSYAMFTDPEDTINYIQENMLLWGKEYEIPLELIKKRSMPVFNIGPWGKDLHRMTERVHREDLTRRAPKILDYTVRKFLGQNPQ